MAKRSIVEEKVQLADLLHGNISVVDTASSFPSSQTSAADRRGTQALEQVVPPFALLEQVVVALEGRSDANIFALQSHLCTTIRVACAAHDLMLSKLEAFQNNQEPAIEVGKGCGLCRGISSEFRNWFKVCDEEGAEDVVEWGEILEVNGPLKEASNKIGGMYGPRREMKTLDGQHNDVVVECDRESKEIGDVALPMEHGNSSVDKAAGKLESTPKTGKRKVGHPVASSLAVVGAILVGLGLFVGTAVMLLFWYSFHGNI